MKQQRRGRWRGERSITGLMNFLLCQHQWRCYHIYQITLVYSFELVNICKKKNSNLLLVVIFSCFFECCGKTILNFFFFLEALFLFIWISFACPKRSSMFYFLSVCSTFVNFLRSVILSVINLLSSNRLNCNWKWKKKKCWTLMRGLLSICHTKFSQG